MSKELFVQSARETCILAALKFACLGLTRTDRSASRRVSEDAHAVQGAARVVVSRLAGADDHHRAITAAQASARAALHARSMPYDEDGWRLLPNVQFEPLLADLNRSKAAFDKAMAELARDADDIIDRARANVGSLNVEVPTREELLSAYRMTTEFRPVPDGAQFKNFPDSAMAKLHKHVENRIAAAVERSQSNTLERFVTPLAAFVDRMKAYDDRLAAQAAGQEVGRIGIFRDSVVENIRELHEVLASFNITGDDRITELSDMLASVVATKPEVLRTDDVVRSSARQRAEEALANLNEWLAPAQRAA